MKGQKSCTSNTENEQLPLSLRSFNQSIIALELLLLSYGTLLILSKII